MASSREAERLPFLGQGGPEDRQIPGSWWAMVILIAGETHTGKTLHLWPIVREMIKTCIENRQNMIIEGCYIPFGWENDFPDEYGKEMAYVCLVFSEAYIKERYADIARYESVIENRKEACPAPEILLEGNQRNLRQCILHSYDYILIDKDYTLDIEMLQRLLHTAAPQADAVAG